MVLFDLLSWHLDLNSRRKLRSQTSDSWPNVATVARTAIENKETEEKESEKQRLRRERERRKKLKAREKVEKRDAGLDVKKKHAPVVRSACRGQKHLRTDRQTDGQTASQMENDGEMDRWVDVDRWID